MSLSDVFEETDAIMDAFEETLFQEHLKELSELSEQDKNKEKERVSKKGFTLGDLERIFNADEKYSKKYQFSRSDL